MDSLSNSQGRFWWEFSNTKFFLINWDWYAESDHPLSSFWIEVHRFESKSTVLTIKPADRCLMSGAADAVIHQWEWVPSELFNLCRIVAPLSFFNPPLIRSSPLVRIWACRYPLTQIGTLGGSLTLCNTADNFLQKLSIEGPSMFLWR